MSAGPETRALIASIETKRNELWSELYRWLTGDERSAEEYRSVAIALADAGEISLAQLVISQAVTQYSEDDHLAMLALQLSGQLRKAA